MEEIATIQTSNFSSGSSVVGGILFAGDMGIFCINTGKSFEPEELYVCNPLARETSKLPPLKFSRHPVVLHARVAFGKENGISTSTYRIIAIGSAANGTDSLSRKTEVYDFVKDKWESAGDVPGGDISLNISQTGVYCESHGLLLCVGSVVNGIKRILQFDVENRKWREDWICMATGTQSTVHFVIAQLVECSNMVYLFSEQEAGSNVTHCIDRLDLDSSGGYRWTRKVTRQTRGGDRGPVVYPEFTCVPLKKNKLCIFNTITLTGVVYDMLNDHIDPESIETIPAPPSIENGVMIQNLYGVGYGFKPSFAVSVR